MITEEKEYLATFAYSGSNKREFFDKKFTCKDSEDLGQVINDYVANQNKGETKSDRIRLWCVKPIALPDHTAELEKIIDKNVKLFMELREKHKPEFHREDGLKQFAECYQPLFNLMIDEYGKTLLTEEMDEIMIAAHAVEQNLRNYLELPSPAPAAPDKGEEKPEDCIVGVNSYAPNGIVDDPFQPNATTESDARAFIFNERMAGRLKGYDKIPYELRTEIYRVMEEYKNLKPTRSVEKSEGEEAIERFLENVLPDHTDESGEYYRGDSVRTMLKEYSSLLHSSGDRGRKEWPENNNEQQQK